MTATTKRELPSPHDIVEENHRIEPEDALLLPYGVWRLERGGEVLFNRKYKAIARRNSWGRNAKVMDGTQHIRDFDKAPCRERYFRDDGNNNPKANRASVLRCYVILGTFMSSGKIEGYLI